MHAADTNVLVRLIVRDNPRQLTLALALLEKGIWISNVVVMETVWVLGSVYGFDRGQLSGALKMMLDLENADLEDRTVVGSARMRYLTTPRVGFEDCLILEIARARGQVPLGTFDRALAKLDDVELLN